MPRVGFEPMIPVLERAKIFYALDREETVIGRINSEITHLTDSWWDPLERNLA
jgi:hypothetical protein